MLGRITWWRTWCIGSILITKRWLMSRITSRHLMISSLKGSKRSFRISQKQASKKLIMRSFRISRISFSSPFLRPRWIPRRLSLKHLSQVMPIFRFNCWSNWIKYYLDTWFGRLYLWFRRVVESIDYIKWRGMFESFLFSSTLLTFQLFLDT